MLGGVNISGKMPYVEVPLAELSYGQTPWDGLSRAELLTEVQRLYSATVSLHGALSTVAAMSNDEPYFNLPNGLGGKALEKGKQAIAHAQRGLSNELISRCFFRYADDLLFQPPVGQGWLIDDEGHMACISREHSLIYHNAEASVAGLIGLKGFVRRITWKDLEPTSWDTSK